jgi:GT2 family glycosyltransferase
MELNDITVVIATFKSEHQIFECIDSIPVDLNILIVENSDDIEFKRKVEEYRSNVQCYLLNQNKGYGAANNFGLIKVKTKYGLLLNPDTRLTKNSLNNFFFTSSLYPNFSIIGPHQNNKEKIISNNVIEVENIKGFAIFFNIKVFKKIFFDENFFLYFEEIDLCKRIKNNGGSILVDPKIIIDHEGGGSVKLSSEVELEKNRNWHWMWSTFYFHKKYQGFLIALIMVIPKLVTSIFKVIFYSLIFNKNLKNLYLCRLSGLFNSIIGKKSWYRPRLD